MVINRVQSGNITYLMGEVTNQSFAWYFPISFVLKTPLPMLILLFGAIVAGVVSYLRKSPLKVWSNFKGYARDHFSELTSILFVIYYSYISITGNLNLGIRHLFPMMPFVFILVAKKALDLYHKPKRKSYKRAAGAAIAFLALRTFFKPLPHVPDRTMSLPFDSLSHGAAAHDVPSVHAH
jgi:hypothetical protein